MIQQGTKLKVADNSGAKIVGCVKVLGGTRRRYAEAGDMITVSVKEATPGGVAKKKQVLQAIIVRTKNPIKRKDGTVVRFDDNAVVIVEKNGEPKGTRIFGPIASELKERGYSKIVSQATEVI